MTRNPSSSGSADDPSEKDVEIRVTEAGYLEGGATVELVQDVDWGYVQVFTTRKFPRAGVEGLAIAIEPMTAPPDALNSGQGVQWIEPGASSEGSWGLRYSRGAV